MADAASWTSESRALVCLAADQRDVPHHLSRPRQHLDRGAPDQQGIRLRQGHDGLHLQRLRLGLCAVPGPRRLAVRSLRRARRADRRRRLLVDHDRRHRRGVQRRLVHRRSLPVRRRRGRRLSRRDARHAAVVSAARTRLGAGRHAQRQPARRRDRAADRGADHERVRLAAGVLHLRRGRTVVVVVVGLELPQPARRARPGEQGGARTHPRPRPERRDQSAADGKADQRAVGHAGATPATCGRSCSPISPTFIACGFS